MPVVFRPLAERNGADQHAKLAAPRRAGDRHGLGHCRPAAVMPELGAAQQVLEFAAFLCVGNLEGAAVEADAVVIREDFIGLGIFLEDCAGRVEDDHAHQHAVDRARIEAALRFDHIQPGMQPDRALQVRQDGAAGRLVRLGEIPRVVLTADAQAALDPVLGANVRAQQVTDAERLEKLPVDLTAAPVAGAQGFVDRDRPVGGQVDEGIDRVVVAVVRRLRLQRGAVLRRVHGQAAAVACGRAQDEAHVAGVQLLAQHFERAAPGHGFHRPFIDRGQQRAELRQAQPGLRKQGRRHLLRLNGRHQHPLSPDSTPPWVCLPAPWGSADYRDAARVCPSRRVRGLP
ncbi:hypothetical protein D3C72_1381190 [compost metagenome]